MNLSLAILFKIYKSFVIFAQGWPGFLKDLDLQIQKNCRFPMGGLVGTCRYAWTHGILYYLLTIWATFKATIEGVFKEKRYTCQSLIQSTWSCCTSKILTDAKLQTYHCKFQAIVHYLMLDRSISEEGCNCYFWFGYQPLDGFPEVVFCLAT